MRRLITDIEEKILERTWNQLTSTRTTDETGYFVLLYLAVKEREKVELSMSLDEVLMCLERWTVEIQEKRYLMSCVVPFDAPPEWEEQHRNRDFMLLYNEIIEL